MKKSTHHSVIASRIRGSKPADFGLCSRCGRDITINLKRPMKSVHMCRDCRQVEPKWGMS